MKRIAVFCGSSKGASDVYIKEGIKLGKELAKQNITLIYGGASVGLMGAVANAVLENGGQVIGVMPRFLEEREISHQQLSKLIIVESMHERKAKMEELADGFIALPGGPGTLEEFFEIFTWAQLGLHHKPFGLLNINGYFQPLVSLFQHMISERFLDEKYQVMIHLSDNPRQLLESFDSYQPPAIKTYANKKQT
ncbi:hypothetical protein GGQ92_002164 [Gracilibacillus halotolerans]|uniref:Cytokinin riboside 5'-monophosphate phosphoribohydrolase n=1 Tax=Gracilibacillus halotolerans TaxID=74386 RepID=A0A841RPQ2_9BACI|nr:TIGR00730 family Rossman fold protein [Gracilibacillus halotolerans]MBB6513356.1 hypothetical protein [Gracilibacillus halotolerans]